MMNEALPSIMEKNMRGIIKKSIVKKREFIYYCGGRNYKYNKKEIL